MFKLGLKIGMRSIRAFPIYVGHLPGRPNMVHMPTECSVNFIKMINMVKNLLKVMEYKGFYKTSKGLKGISIFPRARNVKRLTNVKQSLA